MTEQTQSRKNRGVVYDGQRKLVAFKPKSYRMVSIGLIEHLSTVGVYFPFSFAPDIDHSWHWNLFSRGEGRSNNQAKFLWLETGTHVFQMESTAPFLTPPNLAAGERHFGPGQLSYKYEGSIQSRQFVYRRVGFPSFTLRTLVCEGCEC